MPTPYLAAAAVAALCTVCAPGAQASTGDWPTFAHDDLRSGLQTAPTGITRSTARELQLHWNVALRDTVTSSPIVAQQTVFIATGSGTVYALDAKTGRQRWKRTIGSSVRMTPALVDGRLVVGVYGRYGKTGAPASGASMQALDPASGRVLWKTPLQGVVRSEPVVIHGVIYEGIAGGDGASGCSEGRIIALDERTGKVLPAVWRTSSKPHNGGGIWSPLSYDGTSIYFGTGNTCDGSGAQNAIVALTPQLRTRWVTPAQSPGGQDEDVGGGAMVRGDTVYVEGKSGWLFALDRNTGSTKWRGDVHATFPGAGGFGTPAGDGSVLVVNSGDASTEAPNHTKLVAFDMAGGTRYSIDQQAASTPSLGASFVPGVGFAGIDKSFVAFDARTGAKLWTYPTADMFYAVPAIVASGVYTVDLSGNVYAFGIGPGPNGPVARSEAVVPHGDQGVAAANGSHRLRSALAIAAPFSLVVLATVGLYVVRRRRQP